MQRNAFTLIELSIVLVIIGLIVGGVLVGQDLIKAAELRALAASKESYQTAANTFRLKYNCLPGDCNNATTFFGSTPSCPGTAGTGTQTCNGDGDKKVERTGGAGNYSEGFMFFQHLANAGLIAGTYTGIAGPLHSADALLGVNVPLEKKKGAGFQPDNYPVQSGSATWFDGFYGNILWLGKDQTTSNGQMNSTIFTTQEMWELDTKIDDGKPGTGKMFLYRWNSGCSTAAASSDNATATYDISSSSICAAVFRQMW